MILSNVAESIKIFEGFRGIVYKCPTGHDTIGYGCKLPISRSEAELLLNSRLRQCERELAKRIPHIWNYSHLGAKEILLDMAYNMGVSGLLKFKKTLRHIENCEYELAAAEMLDSKWANQVGHRAMELADKMADLAGNPVRIY